MPEIKNGQLLALFDLLLCFSTVGAERSEQISHSLVITVKKKQVPFGPDFGPDFITLQNGRNRIFRYINIEMH